MHSLIVTISPTSMRYALKFENLSDWKQKSRKEQKNKAIKTFAIHLETEQVSSILYKDSHLHLHSLSLHGTYNLPDEDQTLRHPWEAPRILLGCR